MLVDVYNEVKELEVLRELKICACGRRQRELAFADTTHRIAFFSAGVVESLEEVRRKRKDCVFIIANPSSYEELRKFTSSKLVDFICTNCVQLDEVSVREARKNSISFLFSLSPLRDLHKKEMIEALRLILDNIFIVYKANGFFSFASFAKNLYDLQGYYHIYSFLKVVGIPNPKYYLFEVPMKIAEKNIKIISGKSPARGVEILGFK